MKLKFSFYALYFIVSFSTGFSQYFQQEVNYKIQVSLDDIHHRLNASETVHYTNNSPHSLLEIYFHLWPNAYKNNETALAKQKIENGDLSMFRATEDQLGFIEGIDFKVNGEPVRWNYDSLLIDICKIILNKPLNPGEQIEITTPFSVKIPDGDFSRLGHTGQAYYITQWYPKPAVYDHKGWHAMPYLDYGEYYSEFGSFEVTITIPANYVVGATGELQNEAELKWLERKAEDTKALGQFSTDTGFPASSIETKTISFKQNHVHDFGWFADKRFHVLKNEVELPHSKRKVTSWAMFTNAQAEWWVKAPQYINDALYYFSLWNGDYPYNHCMAVDGTISAGTGMEYPMITIIGTASNEFELEDVIVHEVAHNWFYGILGFNERDYGWMDEGITSFNELRYVYTKYPDNTGKNDLVGLGNIGELLGVDKFNFKKGFYYEYLLLSRVHRDEPVNLTSEEFTTFGYGAIMYRKTALIFDYLKSYLGDSLFDDCMKQFYEAWKFKHPYPEDLQKVFETRTGKSLDWFFNDLLKTNKKIDYAVAGINPKKGENLMNPSLHSYGVTIRNRGNVVSPFSYSTLKDGHVLSTKWEEGFIGKKELQVSCVHCDEIRIDEMGAIPEIKRRNNEIKTSGMFKKKQPLQFKFLGEFEKENRSQVFYTPVIGWNNYNKTMIGAAVYNKFVPHKNVEFLLMPMYATRTKDLAGSGNISFAHYFEESFIHNLQLNFSGSHYAMIRDKVFVSEENPTDYYFTSAPIELTLSLRKKTMRSTIDKRIIFRGINTWQDINVYDGKGNGEKKRKYLFYHQAIFDLYNNRTFDPYGIRATVESGDKYVKTFAEFDYKFSYSNTQKGVDFRLFGGYFISNNSINPYYNFRFSDYGVTDYLYDNIYLGRNEAEGTLSKQTYLSDGGFKIYGAPGQSNKWLTSLNMMIDFPGRLPFRFFVDVGTFKGASDFDNDFLSYTGGICVYVIKDVAEVYFPIFKSKTISDALDVSGIKYKEQIRFMINFKKLNPFKWRDDLLR